MRPAYCFLLAALCVSAPIAFSDDALATHENAQGSVSVGAFVLAPSCTISLRNDGNVAGNCHAAAIITRRDPSSFTDAIPAQHYAEYEADHTVVTVTY